MGKFKNKSIYQQNERLTTEQIDQYADYYAESLLERKNSMAIYLHTKGLLIKYLWNVIEQQNGHYTVMELFCFGNIEDDRYNGGFNWDGSLEGFDFWYDKMGYED